MKTTNGFMVNLTEDVLRKSASVLGICACGKPAQIAKMVGAKFNRRKLTWKGGKWINVCFDCDAQERK